MEGHSNWVTRFIVENNFCLTASADGTMKLWDLETLHEQKVTCTNTFSGHTKPGIFHSYFPSYYFLVTALEIWRDLIFSGSADNTIRIWVLPLRGSTDVR